MTDTERLDRLQKYGSGIALIHDDEGHWIVGGSGMQAIRSTQASDEGWMTTFMFEPEDVFYPTAREAIDAFLAEHDDERELP